VTVPKIEHHLETIRCPNCGAIRTATVQHTYPFWMFVHHCDECDYNITDSEWERVDTQAPPAGGEE